MARDREINPGAPSRGRSGNDYLQRSGGGYESWGAEGPGGMSATGRWRGANAGEAAGVDRQGAASLAERHGMQREGGARLGTLLAGMGIGVALMYFLDPARGTRRRRIFADRARSTVRGAGDAVRGNATDMRNRASGAIAEVRARVLEDDVSDDQLVARVRAELGHRIERVRPIEVVAEDGAVTLRGAVSVDELPTVVSTVEKVRGVQRVVNELTVHREMIPGQ